MPLPYRTSVELPVRLSVAMLPIPTTFAIFTEYAVSAFVAYVAFATVPVTLAPATEFAVVA